jgi:hypothetical protein
VAGNGQRHLPGMISVRGGCGHRGLRAGESSRSAGKRPRLAYNSLRGACTNRRRARRGGIACRVRRRADSSARTRSTGLRLRGFSHQPAWLRTGPPLTPDWGHLLDRTRMTRKCPSHVMAMRLFWAPMRLPSPVLSGSGPVLDPVRTQFRTQSGGHPSHAHPSHARSPSHSDNTAQSTARGPRSPGGRFCTEATPTGQAVEPQR